MRKLLPVFCLLAVAIPASATTLKQKQDGAKKFARELAAAYKSKRLASFDAKKAVRGSFRIVIEHSLAGDDEPGRFVRRSFTSMKKAEQWLRGRTHEGFPMRQIRPLLSCGRGLCTYDFDGGILHNQLYLQKFTYGRSGGGYFVKTLYLLDGD